MKRFIISVIALLALSGVFAQQSVDLELQGKKSVQVVLCGPASSYPVVLSMEASYNPEEELVTVKMRGDNSTSGSHITESNGNAKNQITHLMLPFDWNGFHYHEIGFKSVFKEEYTSKAVLEVPMKNQIVESKEEANLKFRRVFDVKNGELQNVRAKNIVPLQDEKIELEMKVSDLEKPVVLTINNVIPLRANNIDSLSHNKYYLKYISNSYTITFNIPEDKCAKKYDLIGQYEKLNEEMGGEFAQLEDYVKYVNIDSGNIRRQWSLIYKYEKKREEVNAIETECEGLLQQIAKFNGYYNRIIAANALTPDSLERMIDTLEEFRDQVYLANENCGNWKDEAVRYIADVKLDEKAFDTMDEAYNLVRRFNELKDSIAGFNCPVVEKVVEVVVEEPVAAPKPIPSSTQCDCKKITEAKNNIHKLYLNYKAHETKNTSEYISIKNQTDSIIKSMPESCRKKCKSEIEDYRGKKQNYEKRVMNNPVK